MLSVEAMDFLLVGVEILLDPRILRHEQIFLGDLPGRTLFIIGVQATDAENDMQTCVEVDCIRSFGMFCA